MSKAKRNHGAIVIAYFNDDEANDWPLALNWVQTRDLISIEDAEKFLRHELGEESEIEGRTWVVAKVAKRFKLEQRTVLVGVE